MKPALSAVRGHSCAPHVEAGALRIRAALVVSRGGEKIVGPRFVRLLEEIDARGSIRQAALAMGLGYRHAIEWVQRAESALDRDLVTRHPGRSVGAGARLTAEGLRLVEAYARVEREIGALLAGAERELLPPTTRTPRKRRAHA